VDANDKTQPPVIADVVKSIYDKAGIELITNQEITEIGDGEVVTRVARGTSTMYSHYLNQIGRHHSLREGRPWHRLVRGQVANGFKES